ncbi:CHAT domain-containing protein [Nostocoides sp. Soil756]|uniref:CHAT domain-containing protein n=1 Tax=Nostocoides sp. Soil756 TaxID=1736399 RepID=UPI0006F36380|nr:CHAT domain-containing protein [Tetrasphaera sp. Soil756]KRE63368.1 hypothetical protein ASG78_00125 [Tetrasphaera sp. Soil756]
MGRFDAAATAAQEALRALDGLDDAEARRLRVRIDITRAWSELEVDGLGRALRTLHRARREARRARSPFLEALSHVQEGVVHVRVGDWAAALAALDAVPDDAPLDPSQRCALFINRGLAHVGRADIPEATAALETARDIAAEHGLVDQEFKARHNLACLAFVDGDLPKALGRMREADRMEATVSRDRARLDHAEVLLEAGLVDDARSALTDALVHAQADRHRLEVGEISLRLARCDLLAGDLGSARAHALTAQAVLRSRQAAELVREAAMVRMTIDVVEGTRVEAVVADLTRRNVRVTDDSPAGRAAVRLEAEARLALGDPDAAEARLAVVGAGRDSLAATLHESLVRARIALARGLPEEAERHFVEGNRILAAHQFLSSSLDVRAAMALHGRRLSSSDVERALAGGDAADVVRTVERWRAVSHRINPVTTSSDPELTALTRELRRLRRLLGDSDGAAAEALAAQVAALEPQIADREWSLAAEGSADGAAAPLRADELRAAAAAAGARLVGLFESRGTVHAAVVTGDSLAVHPLGPVADLVALVLRLRRDLRARAVLAPSSPMTAALARATASSVRALDAAFEGLWGGDGRVVVVPSGSLAAVPWSLLPSLRGRPVTVAPSLTRWVRGPARRSVPATEVAGALYGPGLVRTGPEVRAVLAAWHGGDPGDRPDPGPASSHDVVDALGRARVVHLAAHGTHEAQSPLFSSVRMADGPLFAHELPRPVAAEHVTLAACDVGQFSTRAGDEPLGLSIALLSLGACAVLAAVAPVADDAAHDAMVAYHRALARGADAAQAWAGVVEHQPDAGVFCLYGSDWAATHPVGDGAVVGLR